MSGSPKSWQGSAPTSTSRRRSSGAPVKESAKSHITFVIIAGIARPLLNLMMNKKWEGTEKLPAGGFIATPNHCTEIDPLVVGHMLYNQKRAPHFLAKAGLFKVPVLGKLLHAVKQIP